MSTLKSLIIEPNVYYKIDEVAQLLRVSEQSILSLLESGKIRGVKIENEWRVLGVELLNLINQNQVESEIAMVSEWFVASKSSLQEVWDNEEDSIYDQL